MVEWLLEYKRRTDSDLWVTAWEHGAGGSCELKTFDECFSMWLRRRKTSRCDGYRMRNVETNIVIPSELL